MFYTVYKITNLKNNKVYIGAHKTKNIDDDYFGSGTYLRTAVKKHGKWSFRKKILAIFDTKSSL